MVQLSANSANHFAQKYRGCGLVGLLALLLVFGRSLHGMLFKHRRISALGAGCPPSMLGGLVGLVVLIIMREVLGMREVVNNARDDFHEMASSFFFSTSTLCVSVRYILNRFSHQSSSGDKSHSSCLRRSHSWLRSRLRPRQQAVYL